MPAFRVPIKDDKLAALRAYITEQLDVALSGRRVRTERYDGIDRLLSGERSVKDEPYDDASNVVTPVTQIRVDAIASRIVDGLFSIHPTARFSNVTGVDPESGMDWRATSREATDWFDWAIRQPTELDGRSATEKAVWDFVRYGLGVLKVVNHTETAKSGVLRQDGAEWVPDPEKRVVYSGPRWFYIAARDLIWPEGYGQSVQQLPWIGQVVRSRWGHLKSRFAAGTYDPSLEARLRPLTAQPPTGLAPPIGQTSQRDDYEYIELWLRYDIDDDGVEEELLIDWSPDIQADLRTVFQPFSMRPLFVARLRQTSGVSFDGMGVPDILRSSQDQIDAAHNIAIDSGRVGLHFGRFPRIGSAIADMLEDEDVKIGPAFTCATQNPQGDIAVVPLGDPRGAVGALAILNYLRQDVDQLVGVGAAQLGDVSSLNRTPSYPAQDVLSQGKTFTREASSTFAIEYSRAAVWTFEVMRVYGTEQRPYRILGQDGLWVEKLLKLGEPLTRGWAVHVAVADPAQTPDAVIQRDLMLSQFLLAWLEKIGMSVTQAFSSPNLPPALKEFVGYLSSISEQIIRRLVENAQSLQDADLVLPHLERFLPMLLQQTSQQVAVQQQQQANMMGVLASLAGSQPVGRSGGGSVSG